MSLDRRDLLGLALAAGALANGSAGLAARAGAIPDSIALWPDGLPEPAPAGLSEMLRERSKDPAVRDRELTGVIEPRLEAFRPRRSNGAAIIAVPGGAYHHLAWDKEGLDIAQWFADRGVAGFALAYRLPQEGWAGGADTPLADVQRAVRLVRANAAAWGIDPGRIAVVGFSAGGHLVANLAAQFDYPAYPAKDAADRHSARPDLVAPVYPAIMLDRLAAAAPPGRSLFGSAQGDDAARRHSPHRNVRENAPPHFLAHAEDDPMVGPEHSLALRDALRARRIEVETHLFARGGHGFGIRNARGLPAACWPELLLAFGRTTGWITA